MDRLYCDSQRTLLSLVNAILRRDLRNFSNSQETAHLGAELGDHLPRQDNTLIVLLFVKVPDHVVDLVHIRQWDVPERGGTRPLSC